MTNGIKKKLSASHLGTKLPGLILRKDILGMLILIVMRIRVFLSAIFFWRCLLLVRMN